MRPSASSPSSDKQVAPVVDTSSSNAIFSPKKVFAPSSPDKTLSSPVHSHLGNADASSGWAPIAGLKPPSKKSVGNRRAFVNINGSPVKIPKPEGNGNEKAAKKARQKSIEDSFGLGKPSARSSTVASCDSSTPDTSSSVALKGSHGGPAGAAESKNCSHSSNGSVSRKRGWDVHNNSDASIFDFFQKTTGSDPTLRIKPPAASTASHPASSPSSAALMVSCPVCQAKVQESKINEHLDSCLS